MANTKFKTENGLLVSGNSEFESTSSFKANVSVTADQWYIGGNLYVNNTKVFIGGTNAEYDILVPNSSLSLANSTYQWNAHFANVLVYTDLSPSTNGVSLGSTNKRWNITANTASLSNTISVTGNATFANVLTLTGNATFANVITVIGATTLSSTLSVSSSANVGTTLGVGTNANVGGNLGVAGSANVGTTLGVGTNANVAGNLGVAGNANVGTTLGVGTNANVGGNLGVAGSANVGTTLGVGTNANVAGNLGVAGNANVTGTLGVNSAVTFANSLTVSGNTNISNTLSATGNVVITGASFTVGGNTNFASGLIFVDSINQRVGIKTTSPDTAFQVSGSANIIGAVVLANTVSIVGAATLSNTLSVTNTASFANTVTITGAATLSNNANVAGNLGVAGSANVGTTLGVGTNANVAGNLGVAGSANVGTTLGVGTNANVAGNLGVAGNANVTGTLGVNSAVTFANTVTITGAVSLGNTLSVTNTASFSNDVTISGNLTVSGTTTYINTNNLSIGDNIITLNADLPAATAPSENAGIEVNRGSSANVSIRWNESTDVWEVTNDGSIYNTLFSGASTNTNFDAGTLFIDATNNRVGINNTAPGVALRVTGAIDVSLTANVQGNANVGGTLGIAGLTTASGNLNTPVVNATSNLNVGTFGVATNGVNVQNTVILIGNTTSNALISGNLVSVSNTANLTSTTLTIGTTTVNSSQVNSALHTAGVFGVATNGATINATTMVIGNTTSNAIVTGNLISVSNTANLTSTTLTIGTTTVNSSLINVASVNVVSNVIIGGGLTVATNTSFDSGTLFIDATNNRVGINNTAPGVALRVTGDIDVSLTANVQGNANVGGTLGIAGLTTASGNLNTPVANATSNLNVGTFGTTNGVNITNTQIIIGNTTSNALISGNLVSVGNTANLTSTTLTIGTTTVNSSLINATAFNAVQTVNAGANLNVGAYGTTNGVNITNTQIVVGNTTGYIAAQQIGTGGQLILQGQIGNTFSNATIIASLPNGNSASIEIGGTTSAFIDFKTPFADDYDTRLMSNTSGFHIVGGSSTSANLVTIQSANLDIDAGTLFIDATNNRVGINNTAPGVALRVTGAIDVSLTANVQGNANVGGTLGIAGLTTASGNLNTPVVNATSNLNVGTFGTTNGVNITNTQIIVGNTTSNAIVTGNLVSVGNTANLTSTTLTIGTTTVNSSLINVSAINVVSNVIIGGGLTVATNTSFDGGTLFIDAVNNRVGVNTTSPTDPLTIRGGSGSAAAVRITDSSGVGEIKIVPTAAAGAYNPLVAAGDHLIVFANATQNFGNLVIAPWSTVSLGMKFDTIGNTIGITANTITLNSNVSITGNLTVSGTTTYINTTNLNVGDNIIVLNADVTGATAPSENAGIEVNRGSSANVQLRWNETNDVWELTNDGTNYAAIVNQGGVNTNFDAGTLFVDATNNRVGINTTSPGVALAVTGAVNITAAANVGTTLGISGAANALSTLGITGAANALSTLGVNGATTLASTLSVAGAANALSTLGITGAANALSTLGVNGATTLASTLSVAGAANALSTLGITGAANALSTLGVNGLLTAAASLNVTGTINATSNLNIGTFGISTNGVNVQNTVILIGNTTSNALISGNLVSVGNTANLTSTTLTIGTTTVNSSQVNSALHTAGVFGVATNGAMINATMMVIGNTTSNALISGNLISVSNTANLTSTTLTIGTTTVNASLINATAFNAVQTVNAGANLNVGTFGVSTNGVNVQNTVILIGNTTSNALISGNLVSVGNTANLTSTTLTIGTTTVNSSQVNSALHTAGVFGVATNGATINATVILIGNTTSNAIVTGNLISVSNTANLTSTTLTIGTTTVNASLINAAAINIVNQTNTATLFVTTSANVGTALTVNSTLLAVTPNASFDSGTLFVDATNNRVGINNTAPGVALRVTGDVDVSATANVQGNANVGGTLGIAGLTTASGNLNTPVVNATSNLNVGQFGTTNGVNVQNTVILVGNTTANALISGNLVSVGNTANLTSTTLTIGTTTVNSSQVNSALHTAGVFGTTNGASVNSTVILVGNNGTNVFVSGNLVSVGNTANLTSTTLTIGTTTVNSSLINAAAINVVNQTNTATLYVTTSANVGTAFTANSTLVNAIALNVVNQTNTATLYVTTSANVGTALTVNSTLLAVTPNANFDSGTLFVDAVNNRVGINNTAPGVALRVTGDADISGSANIQGTLIGRTGVISQNQITIPGSSSAQGEGGQIILGYGNNLASSITGQANYTFNIDVTGGSAGNRPLLRMFNVNGDGTSTPLASFANNGKIVLGGNYENVGNYNVEVVGSLWANRYSAILSEEYIDLKQPGGTSYLKIGNSAASPGNYTYLTDTSVRTGNSDTYANLSPTIFHFGNSSVYVDSFPYWFQMWNTTGSTQINLRTDSGSQSIQISNNTFTSTLYPTYLDTRTVNASANINVGTLGTTNGAVITNTYIRVGNSSIEARIAPGNSFFESDTALGNVAVVTIKRTATDGDLVHFQQGGTQEGWIGVSGTTVTYGAFCGVHWSQTSPIQRPSIFRGTVVETIDEMCYWENEENDQLTKFKVSDTVASKRVYGVFLSWDGDSSDATIAALGTYIIRIANGVTVQGGDLLESNGDGCARVQADDIIRSSTIGKVTSNHVVETYEDGSYLVPCVLYCG